MKNPSLIAALALLTGCATNASTLPGPVQTPMIAVGGTPCDPPMVVPPSIVASVRSAFEEGRTGPRPAITPEDGAAYQKMQEQQRTKDWAALCYFRADNKALATQPVPADRVVFMGDSITQSWTLAHPDFFTAARVSRGISGQTSPQMLLRFRSDVLALKPAAVHILAGVNDIAGNTGPTTLEEVENNIASMVELAKIHGVKVILATPLPAAKFNWAPQLNPREAVIAYADWIRRYAADQDLVLAEYFAPMATADGAMKPELTLDGIHPNKAGYNVMEPITQAAIAKALAR